MDALWNLEDKLKISTRKAVILLVCTSFLVILACLTIIFVFLKKKAYQRNRIASHDSDDETESMIMYARTRSWSTKCGLMDARNALLGSPCWSVAHKWNADSVVLGSQSWRVQEQRKMMVLSCLQCAGCVSRRSMMPVWQRPILMGEKCELPRFSGLILYDERGRPLPHHHCHHQCSTHYQGETEDGRTLTSTTMLIDLL